MANDYLRDYENGGCRIKHIIDMAKAGGHRSIWFTIFQNHPEVLEKLISDFPGTASQCFDAANRYKPLPRNPGKGGDII